MDSNESRADAIKTRMESKLKQIRYDDPLLFEEFSYKIKKISFNDPYNFQIFKNESVYFLAIRP